MKRVFIFMDIVDTERCALIAAMMYLCGNTDPCKYSGWQKACTIAAGMIRRPNPKVPIVKFDALCKQLRITSSNSVLLLYHILTIHGALVEWDKTANIQHIPFGYDEERDTCLSTDHRSPRYDDIIIQFMKP